MRPRHSAALVAKRGSGTGTSCCGAALAWVEEEVMTKRPPAQPDLRIVSAEAEIYDLMRTPETTADRVRRLQMEARSLAVEQVEVLEKVLLEAARIAKEIADGGDAYPVGAREIAGRLAGDLPTKAETLKVIVSRL